MGPQLKADAVPVSTERCVLRLDTESWRAFNALLDRPAADKPRLARLLAERSVLE